MGKKYPENTDDLENFYQKEFSDFSADPSPELWNKIQSGLPKNMPPGGSFLSQNYKWIGGTFLSGVAILTLVYFLQPKDSEPLVTPEKKEIEKIEINAPLPQETPGTSPSSIEQTERKSIEKTKKTEKHNPSLSPVVEPVQDEIRKDVQEEVMPEPAKEEIKETPKPQSFYEKYSKLKKDTLSDLFVPEKK